MMKIVNTVLCLACLGYVSGMLIRKHVLTPADPTADVLAYMNDLEPVLRELGIDPQTMPGTAQANAAGVHGVPLVVIGDETVADAQRRIAAERWQKRLADARAINATTAARPEPGIDYQVRMPAFPQVYAQSRKPEEKDYRNPKSLYEQSKHFKKYGSFEKNIGRKNRGRRGVTVTLRR